MRTNEEIITIIDELRKEKRLSISELARQVGMAKSGLSRYFNRTRGFPLDRANDFAKVLGVTPEFLLGVQPINSEDKITTTEISNQPEIVSIYNQLEQPRQEKVLDFAKEQLEEQNKVVSIFDKKSEETEDYITDYVEGLVAAGLGAYQEDNLHMEVKLRADDVPDEYDTIAKVAGDSMEPLIKDNDLLFIKVSSQVDMNDIGIFQVNGKNFVKKLKRDYDGAWYLQSLNKSYEEIYLSEDEDIRTIGEVVDIYREY
ncbi:Cro/CI family transcriptional regulator [Streptococcus equi subsp. equi]|uniref:LexA family transcriptional regulator n=1 Tax=Streptococcus equi TaxID=1336 RepID=UPI0006580471|nr:S24 family peptidase [Streptococcus equi]CRS95718.1 Cro/CI family transcriptional regulator [Streptococcus equi subsp. equi]CRT14562.1 Cro/CI family transcriptional regulator [Streptococcus equi subsp. equi]CRT18613.1 Cro/CI family transcriptional regulator [Streptococcus equi subsp. equi]HEK9686049.1 helix-turn-helix domain-containing protein [Streptococcus equi subsp. equi]